MVARRRWRLQFSLRSLLAFFAVAAAALGLAMWRVNEVGSQRAAMREIERSGGCFAYHVYDMNYPLLGFDLQPPGPAWARLFVGDFCFADRVELSYSILWQATPVDVRGFDLAGCLTRLPRLDCIDLTDTNAPDDLVEGLRRMFPDSEIRGARCGQ